MTIYEKRGSIYSLEIINLTLFLLMLQGDASWRNGVCSWAHNKNGTCKAFEFSCSNGQCIERELYCDGKRDCADSSDESYCSTYGSCPRALKRCPDSYKCIPPEWFCDGERDCSNGEDEHSCEKEGTKGFRAMNKALKWLISLQRSESATEKWGSTVDRAAVAFYLSDYLMRNATRETTQELAYETSIQLLSKLSKKRLQDIPSTDLASFVNALLVTCADPRKFHGLDIVQELRSRVDLQENYTNPYVLLSLCNAGDTITETDKMKLIDAFWAEHKTFWTDIQAGALMALACASRQSGSDMDGTLSELAMELKQHQYRNGTVENFQTTALVMQALMVAEPESDPDNFDDTKALGQMIAAQGLDGSFGSFLDAYHVLPVLNCRTIVDIRTDHCRPVRKDEISALDDLSSRSGPKVRVQYSLWIGDEKDVERNLALRVPANISFYGVMEMAADLDTQFRFKYTVKNQKPYVNSLSGLQDDPEKGKFWFLYKVVEGQPTPSQESPADVKPKENDHFVMWYRKWIMDRLTDMREAPFESVDSQ